MKLILSDKSHNAVHTDIVAAAKEFCEFTKSKNVKRMIIVYEFDYGTHYSAAGIHNINDAFGMLEAAKFLLNDKGRIGT